MIMLILWIWDWWSHHVPDTGGGALCLSLSSDQSDHSGNDSGNQMIQAFTVPFLNF